MTRNRWYLVLGVGLGLLTAGLFYIYLTYSYSKIVVKANKATTVQTVLPTVTPTPDPLAPYSIVLLGYGGGVHQGGVLTDTIMVAKIDPRKETVTLISVPRDLWVEIPVNGEETKSFKINAAFSIGNDDRKYPNKMVEFTGKAGGGELAKEVIGKVVGFKIDYFAAMDFNGFVKVVNILGGIDVNVQRTFDDPWYPLESGVGIGDSDNCGKTDEEVVALTATMSGDKLEQQFGCRYENLHFDKGKQHLDGITALKFARSRHSPTDGGDFNRAARQRLVVEAIKTKVINVGFLPKIIPTIKTLTGNLTTDVDLDKMNELIGKAPTIAGYEIASVALTDKNVLLDSVSADKQFILSPRTGVNNFDEVHQFINNPEMVLISPTPTPTP